MRDESGRFVPCGQNDPQGEANERRRTSERIAKEIGKSEKYVRRAEEYANGLDAADEMNPGTKDKVLSGELKIPQKDIIFMGKYTKKLPYGYKMKLDAIKRQGDRTDLTSAQPGQRLTSVEKIAVESDESKSQVQRYISLTRLIPELLQMVDDGRIALTPAVELSKLHHTSQRLIYEICNREELTPSYSQTVRMRKLADVGALGEEAVCEIMSEEKANQRERIVIYMDDIKQYYPRNMLPKDITADILKLLRQRKLEQIRRKENRDAR